MKAESDYAGSRADTYVPVTCTIEEVRTLTPREKLFTIRPPDGWTGHQPGQFVQVSLPGHGEAPISIASSHTRSRLFDLEVRRMGTVTRGLHELQAGDRIGLRGPFGTSFPTDGLAGQDLVLIAGGCGLGPLRSLIQFCEDRRDQFGAISILYGARTPSDLLFRDDLETWRRSDGLTCKWTVDEEPEGLSCGGHVGVVTALVPDLAIHPERTTAVLVGPPVMYRFVIAALKDKGLREDQIIVSLERHMKCGVGKCGHCCIEHLYCCLDGPVFRLDRVSQLQGAL